jgi:hypothetical protein
MDAIKGNKAATGNSLSLVVGISSLFSILLALPGTGFTATSVLDPKNSYFFAGTSYNSGGLESVYFNVINNTDSAPPIITIASVSDSAIFNGIVPISVNLPENTAITKVQLFVNDIQIAETAASPYAFSWDTSPLTRGDYNISVKAIDAAGNQEVSENLAVTVAGDTIAPTVSLSTPANNASANGSVIISASANDNVGVTRVEIYLDGSLVLSSSQSFASYNWNTVTASNGGHVLSAKAYDAAGNSGVSSSVAVKVFNDTIAPTVNTFSVPATANSTSVAVLSFSATDNVGVTGYLISESSTTPAAAASGWTASAPAKFTFAAYGARTAYAWAKDAAGNVSAGRSCAVKITDATAPTVSAFTMPSAASTLAVPVSALSATDNVGVTGYLISESSAAPTAAASGWTASAPGKFTFAAYGTRTAYAWAKDAAGNVSAGRSCAVKITDATAPTVSAFTMPSAASTLAVPVSALSATDNVGVTGYLISESSAAPAAAASGWTASAPSKFTFAAYGARTAYAWAKDAAGNVSAGRSCSVKITDATAPTVSAFTMPSAVSTLAVPVSTLSATDNVGVTGYLITESATAPAASASGWTKIAPTSFTFAGTGIRTAHAWAKDAAGNVSSGAASSVLVGTTHH